MVAIICHLSKYIVENFLGEPSLVIKLGIVGGVDVCAGWICLPLCIEILRDTMVL
ncbi:hypothetical protein [Halodesulfovibrio sp.]|uniref:hypothetical protein n=1 Tax=Halodesulfovibrio sp. TaxID=1912772 RepID=UPI0025DAE53D|nr:hypothetical protein [Halodesulfovibrio sp.]MCT4627632.1 hypothetical protein [Halodesulfovibrio sp.]